MKLYKLLSILCISFCSLTLISCNNNSNNESSYEEELDYTRGLLFELTLQGNSYAVSAGAALDKDVIIPERYNGLPVSNIKMSGFQSYTILESIYIPNSIKVIEEYAFRSCSNLKEINIPDSVSKISSGAFYGCTSLEELSISKNVTYIGESITEGCVNLKSIVVDEENENYNSSNSCNAIIETNSNSLIAGCYTSIINNDVVTIKQGAFAGCKKLSFINIPSSVTSIEYCAFAGCESLVSLIIPSCVTNIESWAFYNCANLKEVTIENGLTKLDEAIFKDCKKLESIVIPTSITYIDNSSFSNCISLKNIYYTGSKENWETLISFVNSPEIINAKVTYNYAN